ncbi:MAG: toll/interleukin-1 receptor domain-containing protein [Clostridia bacterium]|nr:toll/interleukin-1 receptor domain-containing protein [Clostridia bacterium]
MSCYLGFDPVEMESGYFFVSYNSDDVTRIQPLVKGLFDAGVPLWYDHALEYGKEWKKQIAKKIRNSDAVLLFLTMGVLHKELSYVREEYEMATEYFEKTVYVVLLDRITARDVPTESVPWWMEVVKNHLIDLTKVNGNASQISEIRRAIGHSANRISFDDSISNGKKDQAKNGKIQTIANQMSFKDVIANSQKGKDVHEGIEPSPSSTRKEDAKVLVERGRNYYNGRGVERNYDKAFECFMEAAEQGDAGGQNWVGVCYERGHGVPQNYGESLRWYKKAAEQGMAVARNNVGLCYYYGRGTAQNYAEAFRWYKKAAEQDHADGQYWVGLCYENGQGTTKNITEAIRWYRMAAQQGNESAKKRLAALGV